MDTPSNSANQRKPSWPRGWRVSVLGVYWLIIAIATHVPSTVGPPSENQLDKLVHCLAYAVLTWLMAWAWAPREGVTWRWMLGIWIIAALYAGIDELLQTYVGRSCDVYDWLADIAGAAIGLVAYRWLFHRKSNQL